MKKINMKRVLSFLLAIIMLMTLVLSATACGSSKGEKDDDDGKTKKPKDKNPERNEFIDSIGGVSETFEGAVSSEAYSSPVSAAKAFVYEEIAGEKSADVLDVVSNGELTGDQIEKANIPGDLLYGADSVEAIEVTYRLYGDDDMYNGNNLDTLAAQKEEKNEKVTVYVIKYGVDWKYFVPMPVTGNTISKTYYDSVFNNDRYQNCTLEVTMEMDASIKAAGETMEMKMTMTQKIMYDNGRILFEQVTTSSGMGENSTQTICAYLESNDGWIECYLKDDYGTWYSANIASIGFSRLEELTPFYNSYLDYTYFTKTNYGFELSGENAKRYFEQALMGGLGSLGTMIDTDTMKLDMFAEYYVQKGVLSGAMIKADVDMDLSAGGESANLKETVITNTTCTNYGTTVVERPNVD